MHVHHGHWAPPVCTRPLQQVHGLPQPTRAMQVARAAVRGAVKPCVQVWLTPDARGHKPQYGSTEFSQTDRHNKLLHLLGGTGA